VQRLAVVLGLGRDQVARGEERLGGDGLVRRIVLRVFGRKKRERLRYASEWYFEPVGCTPWNWRRPASTFLRMLASKYVVESVYAPWPSSSALSGASVMIGPP
jgi:hypothetical protein